MRSLNLELKLEELAISRRLAMSTWLIEALDSAVMTGILPPFAQLITHVASRDLEDHVPSGWDGFVDGQRVDFAEEMLWCTLREFYGWGFPCAETLLAIESACPQGKIIDFGAGSGYWSAVLRARGFDVIAVDSQAPGCWAKTWTNIVCADGIAVVAANKDVPVLVSWAAPALNGPALVVAMEQPGRLLIRCGPKAVTSRSLASLLPERFVLQTEAPVMSATGSLDDVIEIHSLQVASFSNTAPLHFPAGNPLRKLSISDRLKKI